MTASLTPRLRLTTALFTLFLALVWPSPPHTATAQETTSKTALPTIAEKTDGLKRHAGFFPVYWDDKAGKIWLEVGLLNEDLLYLVSLPSGLGSNDVGLDRGRLGPERVVRFERVGPRLLLVAPNLDYRAQSENELERKAVSDAFAEAVVWGFQIEAVTGTSYLIDATDFVVRDAMDVVGQLRRSRQGSFSLDKSRSAVHPEKVLSFPDNTELEARLTFTSSDPGNWVRSVAADPTAVTLRVRQSFIRLPELGSYTPRRQHPRSGFFGISFVDYATPVGDEKEIRWISRHRLEKRNPELAVDDVVEPIVYYLDPGTPEPIRSALLDGARWWADAFEAAGFRDGYRVEMLPDTADLLDVRYNVIQWVHRSTRGWSYGRSVIDPRTGEILKGHVSLGSLRVRQDYLLAEGMLSPYEDDGPIDPDPMLAMALARIRQLSAHEVGHTLGLSHNFASSVNNRASVMDYPAPLVEVDMNDEIVLTNAYDTGIGEWDIAAIRYGYSQFPPGANEENALAAILTDTRNDGLLYISDTDARPAGGAHPQAHLWDNDSDALRALERELDVREVALQRFSENAIRYGRPLATLEDVLVPLYLRHRYQVEAVSKLVGGVRYSYQLRGDDPALHEPVDGTTQRQALQALLETIQPSSLVLPSSIRSVIPPRPPGYGPTRELFDGRTGLVFDAFAPAEVASHMVLDLLTHPQRTARLGYQHLENPSLPGLDEVLAEITRHVWRTPIPGSAPEAEVQRIVQTVWTSLLIDRAADNSAAPHVQSMTSEHLRTIHGWLESNEGTDAATRAHRHRLEAEIERFLFRIYDPDSRTTFVPAPPGSPIGSSEQQFEKQALARRATASYWLWQTDFCAFGR